MGNTIFDNEKLLKVFIWCILKAYHKETEQLIGRQKVLIGIGQFPTGRIKAGIELNMSPSTAWQYLKILENNKTIDIKSNNKYSIVSIVNWGLYQSEIENFDSKHDNKKTTNEQQNNTNKNVKNVKNDKKLNNNIISRPETPYEEIVNLYNTICISFNSIKQITDKRKGNINARYQESKCSIEVFKILFTKMQDSNFLKGGWDSGGKADFDWVMRPTNFVKVLEGKYDNKNQKQQTGNKQSNLSELMEMIEGGVFDE